MPALVARLYKSPRAHQKSQFGFREVVEVLFVDSVPIGDIDWFYIMAVKLRRGEKLIGLSVNDVSVDRIESVFRVRDSYLLDTAEQMAVFAEESGRFSGLQTNVVYEVHGVETSQLQEPFAGFGSSSFRSSRTPVDRPLSSSVGASPALGLSYGSRSCLSSSLTSL